MNRREFELIDGSSQKFWAIEVEGASHTVHYGRLGTQGQRKTKEFASDGAAAAAAAKLIGQKTAKGYQEVGSAAAPAPPPAAKRAPPASDPVTPCAPEEPVPVVAPATSEAPAAMPRDAVIRRSIALEPLDWMWATWRFDQPLARTQPRPFDRAGCLRRLAKIRTRSYGWGWRWETAAIDASITREEALFWFNAMTSVGKRKTEPKQLAQRLAGASDRETLDADGLPELLAKHPRFLTPHVVLFLANIFPAETVVDVVLGTSGGGQPWEGSEARATLVDGLRAFVVPYLSAAERAALRDRLRPLLDPATLSNDFYEAHPSAFYVAALVGMKDELYAATSHWADDHYSAGDAWHDHYHRPQLLVFGLDDPQLVESEMRRLGLPLVRPDYVRAWLAHTGYGALDYIADGALAMTNKEDCVGVVESLSLVDAPENAEPMLRVRLGSKAPRIGRDWLEQHSSHAILGLMSVAAGTGKMAEAALEYLRRKRREGFSDVIEQHLDNAEPAVAGRIRQAVVEREDTIYEPFDEATTPPWLGDARAAQSRAVLPGFVAPASLPPLLVGDRRLSPSQVEAVLAALKTNPPGERGPLLAGLREHAVPASADAFAWALFDAWMEAGAPSKEKWALGAIGHLGGDASALKLTPLVRVWPGESQHQRAVFALECLRGIGSDTALMQLSGIAQKLKFKGLKARAQECMEAIAKEKGMSRPELEDRIVPDCDLDENGTRELDFGPRKFFVALGPEMKPTVRDEAGKLLRDLPKPGKKDDETKAGHASAEWKLIKKQLREVTKLQAVRLEQSMVTGRRWRVEDYETLLVRHPLMVNLVRLLVWGGYDASGRLVKTFRLTDERDHADRNDGPAALDGLAEVGVVHPLELDEADLNAWGEVLSDYAIVPPFSQLGRPTYLLEPGEAGSLSIGRFAGVKVPATALVGTLERLGWLRGIPEDAGIFHEHSKPFYGAGVTAVVEYETGVPIGYMEGWDDQQITRCFFVRGIYTPEMYPDHKNAVALGTLAPVVLSEVLADLHELAAKGS